MLVSVFIPFANEADNLKELVERVEQGGKAANVALELVFVDDGSKDNSFAVATELAQHYSWIKILRHRVNRGLTEAMKTGFKECWGDIIIFLPSDLECHPDEDIPKLLDGFKNGHDIVCGHRQKRQEIKIVLSRLYNEISKFLFKIKLHDMNWIKAFKRECLEDLELRSDWHRFLVQILNEKGYSATEVPVNWYRRKSGKSHFGFKRIPIAFFDSIAVRFVLTFTKAPMRFFGTLGFLQLLTSGTILSWMLYSAFILKEEIFRVRPLLYFVVLLFIAGLICVAMGFLAELIVSVRDDVKTLMDRGKSK